MWHNLVSVMSVVRRLNSVPNWFIYYLLSTLKSTPFWSQHLFDDVMRINFRFRLLVIWTSPHSQWRFISANLVHISLSNTELLTFSEMQDGGRRHLKFLSCVNSVHSGVLIVWRLSSEQNLVQISIIVTEIDALMFQTFS